MGTLIVIEGTDASGKATQTQLLFQRLQEKKLPVRQISFPDYNSPSSALVKMYLKGAFGKEANAVNPYAASAFFAVDRFASFQTQWKDFYESGGILIADRYVTANMIHQAVKISCPRKREEFLHWVQDFEYNKLGLPKPTLALFLEMPPQFSMKLMADRLNKATGEEEKDIHEGDKEYLENTYQNAKEIARRFDFVTVPCVANETLRTIEAIHQEIIKITEDTIT